MAEHKLMGSKGMYKDSPKLSRGEDGKMGVHKEKQAEHGGEDPSAGHEGEPVHVEHEEAENEMHEMHSKHNLERHMLHGKHEHEHHIHEGKGGDKKEMHKRHMAEHTEMLTRHSKESAGINQNEGEEQGA